MIETITYLTVIAILAATIVLQAYFHREYNLAALIRHMEHQRTLHGDNRTLVEALVRDAGKTLKFEPQEPREVRPPSPSQFASAAWRPQTIATPPSLGPVKNSEKGL